MAGEFHTDKAIVVASDYTSHSVMSATPVETVKSVLSRMGATVEEGLPKDVYLMLLHDEFCEDQTRILHMLSGDMLHFLVQVWDNEEMFMDDLHWNYMEYLQIFGLLTYRRGNPVTKEPNKIYVIEEMKDRFYFLLKSKKSRGTMKMYDEWEKIIIGMMYVYGFMKTDTLYEQFLKISSSVVSYEEFLMFLKGRCALWSFGNILQDVHQKNQYFQYHGVKNPDLLMMYLRERADLDYKKFSRKELIELCETGGINNGWPGLGELAGLLFNDVRMNYYEVNVTVRSFVERVQNGEEAETLEKELESIHFSSRERAEEAATFLNRFSENIPVFELKGYSRKEYRGLFHEKQLKKKQNLFTIIPGGKE